MALADCLSGFRAAIALASGVIAGAHRADPAGNPLWTPAETILITESSLLRMHIAWEVFLEGALIDYLMGELSTNESSFLRYVLPVDRGHATKLIVGTQRYFDYARPELVRKLCSIVLEHGEPFESVLKAIHTDLEDFKTVRNAAAHVASSTSGPLDALATRRLRRPCNNITVYELILAIDPASPSGDTVLSGFLSILDTAADAIAAA